MRCYVPPPLILFSSLFLAHALGDVMHSCITFTSTIIASGALKHMELEKSNYFSADHDQSDSSWSLQNPSPSLALVPSKL